jgi:hypothetical protein
MDALDSIILITARSCGPEIQVKLKHSCAESSDIWHEYKRVFSEDGITSPRIGVEHASYSNSQIDFRRISGSKDALDTVQCEEILSHTQTGGCESVPPCSEKEIGSTQYPGEK